MTSASITHLLFETIRNDAATSGSSPYIHPYACFSPSPDMSHKFSYESYCQAQLDAENRRHELRMWMRSASNLCDSPLASERRRGMTSILSALLDLSNTAAVETCVGSGPTPGGGTTNSNNNIINNNGSGVAGSRGVSAVEVASPSGSVQVCAVDEELTLLPYEAIRVEATQAYLSQKQLLKEQAAASATIGLEGGEGEGGGVGGVMSPQPPSSPPAAAEADHSPSPRRSAAWEIVQSALDSIDLTAIFFRTIFVPRQETRVRSNMGASVSVKLSAEEALHWSTLCHPKASSNNNNSSSSGSGGGGAFCRSLTQVTYREQELAFRVLQGLSLCVYHQKNCLCEGIFVYYATEVLQCVRQHAWALNQQRRQLQAGHGTTPAGAAVLGGLSSSSTTNPATSITSIPAAAAPPATAACASTTATSSPQALDNTPVEVDPSLQRVVIALLSTVESVGHYHSVGLTRLVQAGCVKAVLELAYLPCVPVVLRASAISVVSFWMQEMAPFRPATSSVAAAAAAEAVSQQQSSRPLGDDEVLRWMVGEAMTPGPCAPGAAPFPYRVDRASSSKLDSAVRDWCTQNGLSHIVHGMLSLRSGTTLDVTSRVKLMKTVQKANNVREEKLSALLKLMDGQREERL